ncbi:Crp/Fnr family transcriptional regulator [Cyclobacterium xiamenense]|uniref:Crp/Fnr family transcriptional regulator n=1 Tax=Cyclobacterium xiamenense TaxID=1297121 RepID=UPI0035CE9C15
MATPNSRIGYSPSRKLQLQIAMKDQFEAFIYKRVKTAKDDEVRAILSIFNEQYCDKGTLFKKQNTVIQELGFLITGSTRSYFINEKGEEITDEILLSNNFLSDIISVRTNENSPIIIEILEYSNLLVAPMNNVWELLNYNVTFNILLREYMGDRAMQLVKHHLLFLNGSAKQRYEYLVATNPSLLKKFPLKFIASMIGVTPTQLSRIRNQKT